MLSSHPRALAPVESFNLDFYPFDNLERLQPSCRATLALASAEKPFNVVQEGVLARCQCILSCPRLSEPSHKAASESSRETAGEAHAGTPAAEGTPEDLKRSCSGSKTVQLAHYAAP